MNEKLLTSFLTLVLAICLTILFSVFLGYKNFQILASGWSQQSTMSVYLKNDILESEKKSLIGLIQNEKNIQSTEVIPREKILSDYFESFGLSQTQGDGLEDYLDLIPEIIEVTADQGLILTERLKLFQNLEANLKNNPQVEAVSYGSKWLERFSKFFRLVTIYGIISFVCFLLALSFVSSLLMRVLIEKSKYNIEVETLLGATVDSIVKKYTSKLFFMIFTSLILALTTTHLLVLGFKKFALEASLQSALTDRIQSFTIVEIVIFTIVIFVFLFGHAVNSVVKNVKAASQLGYD